MSDLSLTEAECLIVMSRLAPSIAEGDAPMGAKRLFRKIAAYHLGRCIDLSADNVLQVFELYQAAGMCRSGDELGATVRSFLVGVSADELDEVATFLDPNENGDPNEDPARGFEVPRLLRELADRFRAEGVARG